MLKVPHAGHARDLDIDASVVMAEEADGWMGARDRLGESSCSAGVLEAK